MILTCLNLQKELFFTVRRTIIDTPNVENFDTNNAFIHYENLNTYCVVIKHRNRPCFLSVICYMIN